MGMKSRKVTRNTKCKKQVYVSLECAQLLKRTTTCVTTMHANTLTNKTRHIGVVEACMLQTTLWVKEKLFFFLSVATRTIARSELVADFLFDVIAVLPVQRAAPDHVEWKEDGKYKSVEAHCRHGPEEDARQDQGRVAETEVKLLQLN